MLTLPSSLESHQKRPTRSPAVEILAPTTRFGVPFLRFSVFASDAEPVVPTAAASGDDDLLRVRNNAGALEYSLNLGAWTTIDTVTTGQGFAVAYDTAAAVFGIAYGDGNDLEFRTYQVGVGLSAATTVVSEASPIGAVALAFKPTGDAAAFYTLGTSTTLKRLRRTTGSWAGAGTTWTRTASVASLTGVSATWRQDFLLAVTGTEVTTTHERLWAVTMGDTQLPANAWSALVPIAEADAAAALTFAYPHIAQISEQLYITFQQTEAGDVASSRVMLTHTTVSGIHTGQWREPFPPAHFPGITTGAAIVWDGVNTAYLCAPNVTSLAEFTGDIIDLSGELLSCSWRETVDSLRMKLEFAHTSDAHGLLPGQDLRCRFGFHSGTSGAAQYGVTVRAVVSAVRRRFDGKAATITVEADGPWEALSRYRSPAAWTAPGSTTRAAIFQRLAARAGIEVVDAGGDMAPSSAWADTPAFAIAAGETGRATLLRLLAPTPDFLRTDSLGGGFEVVNGAGFAGTPPTFAIPQGDGQGIFSFETVSSHPPAWLRLQAEERYFDAFAVEGFVSIAPLETSFELVRDFSPADDSAAAAAGEAALTRRILTHPTAELVAPVHVGVELFDNVAVTRPGDDDATEYLVIARGVDFRRGPRGEPHYNTVLTLASRARNFRRIKQQGFRQCQCSAGPSSPSTPPPTPQPSAWTAQPPRPSPPSTRRRRSPPPT